MRSGSSAGEKPPEPCGENAEWLLCRDVGLWKLASGRGIRSAVRSSSMEGRAEVDFDRDMLSGGDVRGRPVGRRPPPEAYFGGESYCEVDGSRPSGALVASKPAALESVTPAGGRTAWPRVGGDARGGGERSSSWELLAAAHANGRLVGGG